MVRDQTRVCNKSVDGTKINLFTCKFIFFIKSLHNNLPSHGPKQHKLRMLVFNMYSIQELHCNPNPGGKDII